MTNRRKWRIVIVLAYVVLAIIIWYEVIKQLLEP